jgi:integrase
MEKALEGARDFTDIMGDMPLSAVTPAAVREFRNVLRRVPRQWRKRVVNTGKSLRALADEADAQAEPVPRLAPETVNSTLTGLRSIFSYAVDQDHVHANPVTGIKVERAKDKDVDPAFAVADLNKLFAAPWFAGCQSDREVRKPGEHLIRDHRFWAFMCMLFSGARVSEIGGIHTSQVHLLSETGGFFEFDWTEGEGGRQLKNKSSVRVVPIHKELIRLGFFDYVRAAVAAGNERLFPGWQPQRRRIDDGIFNNEYSASPFLKRFKTYLVWLGIKRPGLSVKSFRATWEPKAIRTGSTGFPARGSMGKRQL